MFRCRRHRRGQAGAVDPQPVKKVADTLKENIRRQNCISEPLHGTLQIAAEQPELIKANLEMDVQNNRFLGAIKQKYWKPPQSQTLERKRHRKWRRKKK